MPWWLRVLAELIAKALLILGAISLFFWGADRLALPLYYSAWFNLWIALPLYIGALFGFLTLIMVTGWSWKRIGYLLDHFEEALYRRANFKTNGR